MGGIEGRELHLNTLELAAPECGAGKAATLPKLAALLSPSNYPLPLPAPISQERHPGSGLWVCPSHARST